MSKCSAKNRRCAGGDEWCIGGTLRIEDGATLDVAEGATVNGLAAGGGGGNEFIINVTITGEPYYTTAGNVSYRTYGVKHGSMTMDKTYDEILNAYESGMGLIALVAWTTDYSHDGKTNLCHDYYKAPLDGYIVFENDPYNDSYFSFSYVRGSWTYCLTCMNLEVHEKNETTCMIHAYEILTENIMTQPE